MTRELPGIAGAVQRALRTTVGKRFRRFLVAAVAAVFASQITLTTCLGPLRLTAGRSALAAWVAGAAVSYVVSRWAWERKGRPHVLKETLPFWAVAVGTAIVLTSTSKFANQQAYSMHLQNAQRVMFVDAAFFLANSVTFVTRFVIFHYVLFADRGARTRQPVREEPMLGHAALAQAVDGEVALQDAEASGPGRASPGPGGTDPGPLTASGSGPRAMAPSSWAAGAAERSLGRRPGADTAPLPEPGTRP